MGKKISQSDRLLDFAMSADESALDTAIATLLAVKRNRFPTVVQKAKAPAKPRPPRKPKSTGVITGDKPDDTKAPDGASKVGGF